MHYSFSIKICNLINVSLFLMVNLQEKMESPASFSKKFYFSSEMAYLHKEHLMNAFTETRR